MWLRCHEQLTYQTIVQLSARMEETLAESSQECKEERWWLTEKMETLVS